MNGTGALARRLAGADRVAHHAPWPRWRVTPSVWQGLGTELSAGRLELMGLWGDVHEVHMALREPGERGLAVASLEWAYTRFPSIGRLHAPAIRLERTVMDLFGLEPEGAPDLRPWLDHGVWHQRRPLAAESTAPRGKEDYPFLPADGPSLHQIPVGPVHAGIIEPGHFRFTCNGETVVRLEERLGWVHKGIEGLLRGADPERAAKLVGRVSGDSTVAYATAFARAVEAATATEAPPRAHWLRAVMAELERIANHLGDIGAVCNDAAFAIMHAHTGILREEVLQAADACFGHRLMMDRVVPGGVTVDLDGEGARRLQRLISSLRSRFRTLVALYDNTPSLQDRTGATGIVRPSLISQFAAGGFVGRAGGRAFDARKALPYPPYDELGFEVPVLTASDVDARVWVRIREVEQSLQLLDRLVTALPASPLRTEIAPPVADPAEGMAVVEGFRGDVLVWLRLGADLRVLRCHPRDPSWFQWPLLEAAIEGNIVADFPLCNKSFNCSYSGHDV